MLSSSPRRRLSPRSLEFVVFEAMSSFPTARKLTEKPTNSAKCRYAGFQCPKVVQKCRFFIGQMVTCAFVFIHIPASNVKKREFFISISSPLLVSISLRCRCLSLRRPLGQRSAFSVQRSAFSVQRSAFSVQRSAFSVQRSAFSVQRSAFSLTLYTISTRLSRKINKQRRLQNVAARP